MISRSSNLADKSLDAVSSLSKFKSKFVLVFPLNASVEIEQDKFELKVVSFVVVDSDALDDERIPFSYVLIDYDDVDVVIE